MTKKLALTVRQDIELTITMLWNKWLKEADSLTLCFATNEMGNTWDYQCGDGRTHGRCYGLPHRVVVTIDDTSGVSIVIDHVIDQLEEALEH